MNLLEDYDPDEYYKLEAKEGIEQTTKQLNNLDVDLNYN